MTFIPKNPLNCAYCSVVAPNASFGAELYSQPIPDHVPTGTCPLCKSKIICTVTQEGML